MPHPIHTVVLYPRPHPDNVAALFLLREFGQEQFPGIEKSKLEFWTKLPEGKTADELETEGVLLIDIGGGTFDHHQEEHHDDRTTCATTLVARFLGIADRPELRRLLEFVRRDDLEGRGTVSKDVIDRAFGLSATFMNFNRDYPDHPEYVVEIGARIFGAHYHEEYRRKVLMPQEWAHLNESGLAQQFTVATGTHPLRVVLVQTDSKAMVGYLRAISTIQADVVVQRQLSGHTNIVTRQIGSRLNLLPTVAAIRRAEATKKGLDTSSLTADQLEKPRRLEGLEEWYFDTAANTIQNGGAVSADVDPTRLSLGEIKAILTETLPGSVPSTRTR